MWYILIGKNHYPVDDFNLEQYSRWWSITHRNLASTYIEGKPLGKGSGRTFRVINKLRKEKVWLSTVFLGLDHGYDESYPILYETLVFGGIHDGLMRRYGTYDEAMAGHEELKMFLYGKKI